MNKLELSALVESYKKEVALLQKITIGIKEIDKELYAYTLGHAARLTNVIDDLEELLK